MMKKWLALGLVFALLCCGAVLAEPEAEEEIISGADVYLGAPSQAIVYFPDGYDVRINPLEGDRAAVAITPEGRDDLVYYLTLTKVEALESRWFEDLDEAELETFLAAASANLTEPQEMTAAEEGGYYTCIALTDMGYPVPHALTLCHGWICDVFVDAADEMTDEDVALCAYFLMNVSFEEE